MPTACKIAGTGNALPKTCVTNADLVARGVETSHEWIFTRTGIAQRYLCEEGESTFTLARDAAQNALKDAQLSPQDIDLIIVATCTPDHTFPSVATQVHGALGCKPECMAFDTQAACSGFVYAMTLAHSLMQSGAVKHALVIGAESFSKILDWQDRTTCVLFGDGAGAVVLKSEEGEGGILARQIFTDGTQREPLHTTGGTATTGDAGYVRMNGREVFKNAVRGMGQVDESKLREVGVELSDIDWVVPHQANKRIIESASKLLTIPQEKCVLTMDLHANTSAASIPLALDVAKKDKRIQKDNLVLLQSFGAGFTWGWLLLKW